MSRLMWPLATAVLLGAGALVAWQAWPVEAPALRGKRLFEGGEVVKGTLAGHANALPAAATRCANCHSAASSPGAAVSFGTPLGRGQLLAAQARRGGPPSLYTSAAFCTALRTGVDPAHVVLPRAMPRFAIDDAQCAALWAHLTDPT